MLAKIEILEEIQEEQDISKEGRSERRLGGQQFTYYKQWLPATVVMISTGLEKKQGKKGRCMKVPPGQFFISFDDGENRWIPMKKDDFNCLRVGSWRLDLDFLENRPEGNDEEEGNVDAASEKSSEQEEVEVSESGVESDEDGDYAGESD